MDHYRQLLELSNDCVKEIDAQGVVVAVSANGLKLLGTDASSDVLQRSWADLWPERSRELVEYALREAAEGRSSVFEAQCPTFRGDMRVWNVRVAPLRDGGLVTGALSVSTDVTDLANAVHAKEVLNVALADSRGYPVASDGAGSSGASDPAGYALLLAESERRLQESQQRFEVVEDRLFLTNRAYQELEVRHHAAAQALGFAEAARSAAALIAEQAQKGEAVGQLLAGVVHDLNNIIQAASGAVELVLVRGQVEESDSRMLLLADGALRRGAEMSSRLMGFARKHQFNPQPVAVSTLIEEMEPLLRQAVSGRSRLAVTLCDKEACALVDRNTMERTLLNLVVNARDASDCESEIRVSCGRLTVDGANDGALAPGRYVTISVQDDGVGMDEEIIAHIFDVYFTTKLEGEGTGLGLAQVRSAVQQAGGRIEVSSVPGDGATFVITLPEYEAAASCSV